MEACVKMAWEHTYEKRGYGLRAIRKEGSRATRHNLNRDVVGEPISAGKPKKKTGLKHFGIECRWGSLLRMKEWGVWTWYETEKQRDQALEKFRSRTDILNREWRPINR